MPLRRALQDVSPYRPAPPVAVMARELGLERIVKLASNEGAHGPLPEAVAAFEAAAGSLGRYPDGGASSLRQALADRYGVPAAQIVPGNGADELIRLSGTATLDTGDAAVLAWPSFPSYLSAAAVHGAEAVKVPLAPDRSIDLDAMLAACRAPSPAGGRVKVVFLANPNNPTGHMVAREDVRRFVDELPDHVLCVLDEAYAEYATTEPEGPALVAEGRERLAVLRTFSKAYGLAALRVGYAVASPEIVEALDRVRPIFNVSQPAQDAALASLAATESVAARVGQTRAARDDVGRSLTAAGLEPVASQTNFVFAQTTDGDGAGLADRMLRAGYAIRALGGFGAPEAVRVTVGTPAENEGFGSALAEIAARTE